MAITRERFNEADKNRRFALQTNATMGWEDFQDLDAYRVANAVILADGPEVAGKPAGLAQAGKETMIEHLIKQVRLAGVSEVAIVVADAAPFEFLIQKYRVKLISNNQRATGGTASSLLAAKEYMGNAYICSADQYFSESVFEPFAYAVYLSLTQNGDDTVDLAAEIDTDEERRIVRMTPHATGEWRVCGPAFFDVEFASQFLPLLEKAAQEGKRWEEALIDQLQTFDVRALCLLPGIVFEGSALEEIVTE